MAYEIDWRPGAIEDVKALFEYLVENASLWDASDVTERILRSTQPLLSIQIASLRGAKRRGNPSSRLDCRVA